MKKTKILLFLILMINLSCKKEPFIIKNQATKVISDKEFTTIQNIKSETLEGISDSLLFSTLPLIINDYLFISENKSDHLLHTIKIPEDKYVGKNLNSGSGPGEALIAWTLYENEGLLGVYDDKQKKLIEFEIDSLNNKIIFKNEYKLLLNFLSVNRKDVLEEY